MSNFTEFYNRGVARAFDDAGIPQDQAVYMWKVAMDAGGVEGGVPVEQQGDLPPMEQRIGDNVTTGNEEKPKIDASGITAARLGGFAGTTVKAPAGESTKNEGNAAGGLGMVRNEHLIPSTQAKSETPNFAEMANTKEYV